MKSLMLQHRYRLYRGGRHHNQDRQHAFAFGGFCWSVGPVRGLPMFGQLRLRGYLAGWTWSIMGSETWFPSTFAVAWNNRRLSVSQGAAVR